MIFTLDGSGGYQLLAISKKNGQVAWQKPLANAPASPPVYAEGGQASVLVIDEQGNLNAWNAGNGEVLWQSAVGKATTLAPAVSGEEMAVLDPDGAVRLLSLLDGSLTWEIDLGTPLAGTPTITQDLVLVPAKDTYLYGLDRGDGAIKQKRPLAAALSSAPIVVGDHVYCCDEMGGVHSMTLPNLELSWSKSLAKSALKGPVFSSDFWSLVGGDGTLLVYKR